MGPNPKHYLHPPFGGNRQDKALTQILMKVLTPFSNRLIRVCHVYVSPSVHFIGDERTHVFISKVAEPNLPVAVARSSFHDELLVPQDSWETGPGALGSHPVHPHRRLKKCFLDEKIDGTKHVDPYRHHPIGPHPPALQLHHQLGIQSIYRQFDIHRFLHLHSKWW